MNIIICDDDPAFRKVFCHMLEDQFALRDWTYCCRSCSSGQELLSADLSAVQVVFLDIDMPGLNGLETARNLRSSHTELIIVFVTSFPEYALEGYCVEALRYLLKKSLSTQLPACLDAIEEKLLTSQKSMHIQTADQTMEIRLKDILYFEGTSRRRVLLHTCTDDPVECLGQLGDYESRLEKQDFLRIQKSYLVNMRHIKNIRNYMAKLSNGEILKVSEKSYGQITKQFVLWRGRQL